MAGRRFATIVSGANVNFDRLRHIAERAELGEHRESPLAVTIPERPGSLLRFCELIGDRSITEFNYRYSHDAHAHAHIFVGVEITDPGAGKQAFVDALENDGYPVLDLTDNEMAKLHVRYMVGDMPLGISTRSSTASISRSVRARSSACGMAVQCRCPGCGAISSPCGR